MPAELLDKDEQSTIIAGTSCQLFAEAEVFGKYLICETLTSRDFLRHYRVQ